MELKNQLAKRQETKRSKEEEKKLLREEAIRLLKRAKMLDPSSEEYSKILVRYYNVREAILDIDKMSERHRSRVVEMFTTFGLAVMTLTVESWTPITSKWSRFFMGPFRSREEKDWY